MKKTPLILLALCLALPAHAEPSPDLISLGGGVYNFDKAERGRKSGDIRAEYRWGTSLLPMIAHDFVAVDPYVQLHPALGLEANTKGALYGNAGLNLDITFLRYGILTWSESIGAFTEGNDARPMGSMLQFRSQIELGFKLPNALRITGFISHISNAYIAHDNPGAEIAGVYLHIPTTLLGAP